MLKKKVASRKSFSRARDDEEDAAPRRSRSDKPRHGKKSRHSNRDRDEHSSRRSGRDRGDRGERSGKKGKVKLGPFGRPIDPNAPKRPKTPRRKPIKFIFKAPKEYKSGFIEVGFSTDKDGFIAPGTTVDAVKGKPDNPDNPRYDMIQHDPDTALALVARLSMLLYVSNPAKRITANTYFLLLVRVSVSRTKAGELRVGIKKMWRESTKSGKLREVVDSKDLERRRIRRAGKFLAGAFTDSIDLNTLKQMDKEYQAELDRQEADDDEQEDERPAKRRRR